MEHHLANPQFVAGEAQDGAIGIIVIDFHPSFNHLPCYGKMRLGERENQWKSFLFLLRLRPPVDWIQWSINWWISKPISPAHVLFRWIRWLAVTTPQIMASVVHLSARLMCLHLSRLCLNDSTFSARPTEKSNLSQHGGNFREFHCRERRSWNWIMTGEASGARKKCF